MIFLFWLSAAIGNRMLRAIRAPLGEVSALERGVLSAAVGLGLIQYLAFGLGMARVLTPGTVVIGLGILTIAFARDMLRVARGLQQAVQRRRQALPDGWIRVGVLLLLVPLGIAFCQALCPPTDSDGLFYHLTAPKRWLIWGYLGYLPTVGQTNAPMGVEMLFTLAMAVWSDTAAKLIHYALGILTLLAIFALGRRLRTEAVGFAAVSLFLVHTSRVEGLLEFTWAFVDMGITCLFVCAVLAWLLWSQTGSRGWLLCSALCAGFGVSFKLTGAFYGLVLGLAVILQMRWDRQPIGSALKSGLIFIGISLLPVLPWLWRTWLVTGNPLYPALPHVFPTRDWSAQAASSFDLYFKYYLWAPYRNLSLAQRAEMRALALMSIIALATLLLWRWRKRDERALVVITAASMFCTVWWFGFYARYSTPVLPLVCLIICVKMTRALTFSRWAHSALLVLTLANGIVYANMRYMGNNNATAGEALAFVTGRVTREDYLARMLPSMPLWNYVNTHVPANACLLMSNGMIPYYYSNRYCLKPNYFGGPYIHEDRWEHLVSDIQRNHIEYVVFQESSYWAAGLIADDAREGPADPCMPSTLQLVRRYGRSVFVAGGYRLYHLENVH